MRTKNRKRRDGFEDSTFFAGRKILQTSQGTIGEPLGRSLSRFHTHLHRGRLSQLDSIIG
jgi:DNA-directed RNA polymerase specialized sigma24 family protein